MNDHNILYLAVPAAHVASRLVTTTGNHLTPSIIFSMKEIVSNLGK